ncbi:MAG: CoA synthetase [Alphaproteobacteria bacterium]|nr:CoA synthetase [Alphaproteobacteria bacterium]
MIRADIDALVAGIADGTRLAIPANYAGVAMAATAALIRRGVRDLHLVCVPTSGLQADMLIGAGAVASVESSAVTLDEFGTGPRFVEAVRRGSIRLMDATCPAIHAALQAAQKGLPFMPLRGIIGSDLLNHRSDWKVIDNPFAEGEPIVLLPAIAPDVALFHAPLADREGNVWIGRRRELLTMAQASARTLVSVERIQEESLLDDERWAAGTLPALYVEGIAEVRKGAWPVGLWDSYGADGRVLAAYARAARSDEGFAAFMTDFLESGAPAEAAE